MAKDADKPKYDDTEDAGTSPYPPLPVPRKGAIVQRKCTRCGYGEAELVGIDWNCIIVGTKIPACKRLRCEQCMYHYNECESEGA